MTAPLRADEFSRRSLEDVLAGLGERWAASALVEFPPGRIAEHRVQLSDLPALLVDAVLSKKITPLERARQRPRTLGLVTGGAVITGGTASGHLLVAVPLPQEQQGFLWLVLPAGTRPDLAALDCAAKDVAKALAATEPHVDPLVGCLDRGDALPSNSAVRLVALPAFALAALRRSGWGDLPAVRRDGALVVVLTHGGADAKTVALDLVRVLGDETIVVGDVVEAGMPTGPALRRLEACLALDLPGGAHTVQQLTPRLLLAALRPALEAATELCPDPLGPLRKISSGSVDFCGTLLAWLDAHGEAKVAALRLGIHVNTLRYRVGRALALLSTDLTDPDERLALHLSLRLRPENGPQSSLPT